MRFDISVVIPGIPFNGETFEQVSIGGSESAGYYLAKALEALGHRVTVFTNTDKTSRSGEVYYMPISLFRQYVEFTPHDVLIVQRAPELFAAQHNARFAALWCHDLALGRASDKIRGVSWNYDKVFVLSQFMQDQYEKVYGLPKEVLYRTRNGVDLATVESVRAALRDKSAKAGSPVVGIPRDPFQLVYAARPERGADVLFGEIMPRVLELEPRANLACCTYNNPVEHLQTYYQQCTALAKRLGDRVRFAGHLTKRQLYELFLQSGLYVYPVPALFAPEFYEVSCIAALEAQACGLPMVTSKHGALPETLHSDAGVLIDEPMHTVEYYDEFAQQVVRLMLDREAWQRASDAGVANAQNWDWLGVAKEWSDLFEQEIRARSANKVTLANHFWRRSDIFAAKAVIEQVKSEAIDQETGAPLPLPDMIANVAAKIDKDWAFLDEEDGFRKQYERIGATHDAEVINWVSGEPRYQVLRGWLQKHHSDIKQVLDYGCAHGAYDINLLKELPDLSITGVDIDENGINMADGFAKAAGLDASRWRGFIGDWQALDKVSATEGGLQLTVDHEKQEAVFEEQHHLFDAAIAQEVLEHVPEPWEVLKALEARVKDGGYVYITIPFGPWEYTDYRRYPHRAHVWEFDLHDIYDMLEGKGKGSEVTINAMPAPEGIKHNPYTGEPQGWWLIMYRVTAESRGKVGRIDMERKLWCQRPRQTVSACIIAGERSRENLLWCLDSLEHVADEVVLVDCGMADADKVVLALSTIADGRLKVIQGVDPKTEGFETPRNMGLEYCTGDWVCWIDTDEKLLQPEALTKYLRSNIFNGYSIKQHHFAVDTHFDADMPVRVFRNPKVTGSKMRWYGCVAGNTMIEMPGGAKPIKDLVGKQPWIYSFDAAKDKLVLTKPSEVCLTKQKAVILAITLDDGTIIKATPEHPFLLRQHYRSANKWKRADELNPGDSLMPFYRRPDSGDSFYTLVRRSNKDWVKESHFVCSELNIEVPEKHCVHHKDHNPANNDPSNLVVLIKAEHNRLHHKGKVLSRKTRALISKNHASCDGVNNSMWGRNHSEETRKLIGQKSQERGAGYGKSKKGWFTSERVQEMNKKLWADPEHRAKRIAAIQAAKYPDNHKVVRVERAGYGDVYNMEVPKTHTFIAGGVVVHNCIHEHPEEGLNTGPGRTIVLLDVHIPHVGYLIESGRKQRFARNLPMLVADSQRYPDRILQKHFIMRDNMLLCTYELQQTGGVITSIMKARAQQTINLWREHFKGKEHFSNIDPITYYSQANALLGQGFDMYLSVAADKIDAKPNGGIKVRFADMDDAMAEVDRRARAAVQPFVNPHY